MGRFGVSLVVVVLLLGACGGDDRMVSTGKTPSSGGLTEVPVRMVEGGEGGYGFVVATDAHLVGVGGGGGSTWGEAIDLQTGEVTDVPPPPLGSETVLGVVAEPDGIVVVANALEGEGPPTSDVPEPVLLSRVSYRFALGSGRWSKLALPDRVATENEALATVLVSGGPTGVVGSFLVDGGAQVIAVADEAGWSTVAEITARPPDAWCATGQGWWTITATDVPEERTEEAPYPATLALEVQDLVDGQRSEVALPPVLTEFGGAGVELACGADHVAVMSGSGGPTAAAIHVREGDGWRANDPPSSEGWLPSATASGPGGPFFSYVPFAPGTAYEDRDDIRGLWIDDEGQVIPVEESLQDSQLHLAGEGPRLVVVGPVPAEGSRVDRVPLRVIERG